MIAFSEDHEARWYSDPANNVQHSIRVTTERSNTALPPIDEGPDKRLKRLESETGQ